MTYVIAQPCVDLKDRACVSKCPLYSPSQNTQMLSTPPPEFLAFGSF